MFSKTSFSIFLVGIFLFGFAFLVQPQSASAGVVPTGLGCCVNNGNNCNPGCGSEGDECFRDFDQRGNGPCPTDQMGSGSCGGDPATNVGCFIEGLVCFQVTDNKGECREQSGGGCNIADDCPVSNDPTCFDRVCESSTCGFVGTGDPSCEPADPTGTTGTTIIPTMGQWGMLLAAVVLGFFAILRLRSIKDSEI